MGSGCPTTTTVPDPSCSGAPRTCFVRQPLKRSWESGVPGGHPAVGVRRWKMSQPLSRREVSILSPLRYPGAKRRLSGYMAEVLRLDDLRPKLFVEPFAGGA